ncbi:MAG: DUF2723 domain-containing protein [Bacteroidetes bacterium]|nr:DUF2723 domain-containing protein [Bacteroidota bacterium]
MLSTHGNALLVSLAAFAVYLKTLAPTVSFIDSGELAAVACTLGIAHPTGYPLFTLLGWFFSKLPIAGEEIVRLNIMSAFLCAAGVFVVYHIIHFVLTGVFSRGTAVKFRKKESFDVALSLSSAGGSLLLAFSETYWSQAVAIEVYSLHVFLLSLVIFSFLKAAYHDVWNAAGEECSSARWWYIFAFTLGLAFTNHMTTILLAPGLLYLYFSTQGFDASSWRRIGRMAIPFLVGFSLYLYLPVRAAQSPILNWGNPATLEKFLWHWTGKQYRVWIFSSTEAAGRQLKYFIESLPVEFAYIGLILASIGVVFLLRGNRKVAISVLLLFFGCLFYSINYDIHDIDSYFLLAYVCIALLAGAGILGLYNWLYGRVNSATLNVLIVVLCLMPGFFHYDRTDESENYLVEDYTKNMFASIEPNALVFSYQWDYWVSASYYYQFVKHQRPDIVVVDKELLRRSWYFKQLEQSSPWLIEESRVEVDAFLKELNTFERELPYDARVIEARFVGMIRSFIAKSIVSRPVYVTTEIEPEFTAGMQRVPEGLALRVYNDTLRHEMRNVEFIYRSLDRSGRLEDALRNLYATALNARGMYWIKSAQVDSAAIAFHRALEFNPNSTTALNFFRQVEGFRRP